MVTHLEASRRIGKIYGKAISQPVIPHCCYEMFSFLPPSFPFLAIPVARKDLLHPGIVVHDLIHKMDELQDTQVQAVSQTLMNL